MRLIDADALKEEFDIAFFNDEDDYKKALRIIDNAPTVPLPDFKDGYKQAIIDGKTNFQRPQGEWEYNQYDGNPNIGNWHCSECRHIISGKYSQYPNYNFCPYCGADMRGKDK